MNLFSDPPLFAVMKLVVVFKILLMCTQDFLLLLIKMFQSANDRKVFIVHKLQEELIWVAKVSNWLSSPCLKKKGVLPEYKYIRRRLAISHCIDCGLDTVIMSFYAFTFLISGPIQYFHITMTEAKLAYNHITNTHSSLIYHQCFYFYIVI